MCGRNPLRSEVLVEMLGNESVNLRTQRIVPDLRRQPVRHLQLLRDHPGDQGENGAGENRCLARVVPVRVA